LRAVLGFTFPLDFLAVSALLEPAQLLQLLERESDNLTKRVLN
jgi:hypothetical protein